MDGPNPMATQMALPKPNGHTTKPSHESEDSQVCVVGGEGYVEEKQIRQGWKEQ